MNLLARVSRRTFFAFVLERLGRGARRAPLGGDGSAPFRREALPPTVTTMSGHTTMSPADATKPIPYKIMFVVAYSALFVYIFVQIWRTLRGKNKKQSFNFGFLLICILWVGVRLVYFVHFITNDPDPSPYWELANTAAVDIQFAALTFLMLFYVRTMLRMKWQSWRKRLAVLVFVINALFDVFSITVFIVQQLYTSVFPSAPAPSPQDKRWIQDDAMLRHPAPSSALDGSLRDGAGFFVVGDAAPAPAPSDDGFSDALGNVFVFFCGFVFFVLSISMFVFGVRLCHLHDTDLSVNAKEIAGVTITLAVIFGSRSVFDFFNTFETVGINFPACGDTEDFEYFVFLLFIWWECVPIILLLVTLAKSMYREKAAFGKRSTFEPSFGLFAEMDKERRQTDDTALLGGGSNEIVSPPSMDVDIDADVDIIGRKSFSSDRSTTPLVANDAAAAQLAKRPGYGSVDDNYMDRQR